MNLQYETLQNLDSQPYYAFVDLIFGGHVLPAVPSDYLQNLTIQDVGDDKGATVSLILLDKYGDEVEELLYRASSETNYIRFGHVNGRQSRLIDYKTFNYTSEFSSLGTILTITGASFGYYANLSTDNIFNAGSSPSKAVKKICDKLGYRYDDTTIHSAKQIPLSDGKFKEFKLVRDNPIDYIQREICPYALRESDGMGGYQFYLDNSTKPPTAYFHPVDISSSSTRTYVYKKGLNSNVISFEVSADFVIAGNGEVTDLNGITSVYEANTIDPVTKKKGTSKADVNKSSSNTTGNYSHKSSNQSVNTVDVGGLSYGEASALIEQRIKLKQKTFEGTLTIVGDPTVKISDTIRIIVLTKKNNLHHTSGLYLVNGVTHNISSGIMTTTLSVTKQGDTEGGFRLETSKSIYK